MHEYLKFPLQNHVGKKLSNTRYIRSANQTKAESKWLAAYLESVEILYSFPYQDGEIVVLLAEYLSTEHGKYSLNNFVMAIAQSLPYKILLIVKCEGVIRFFAFNERANTIDGGRSRVLSVNSSADIIPLADDIIDNMLVNELREAAYEATSAEELNKRWYSALSGNGDSANALIVDTFDFSNEKYRKLHEQRKAFDKVAFDSFEEAEDSCGGLYEGESLDIDDEIDHKLFVEFCAYYAFELFENASDNGITEEEWLHLYIDGCSSFAKNIFNRVLSSKGVAIISSAYWHGNDEYIDAADCYDIDELKEHIGDFYFEDYEE